MHLVSWVRFVEFSESTSTEGELEMLQGEFLVGNQLGFLRNKFCKQTNKQMQHAGWVQIQEPDPDPNQ